MSVARNASDCSRAKSRLISEGRIPGCARIRESTFSSWLPARTGFSTDRVPGFDDPEGRATLALALELFRGRFIAIHFPSTQTGRFISRAERPVLEEGGTTCCHAQSEKSRIDDPCHLQQQMTGCHGQRERGPGSFQTATFDNSWAYAHIRGRGRTCPCSAPCWRPALNIASCAVLPCELDRQIMPWLIRGYPAARWDSNNQHALLQASAR